jgi:hypothetical protein
LAPVFALEYAPLAADTLKQERDITIADDIPLRGQGWQYQKL